MEVVGLVLMVALLCLELAAVAMLVANYVSTPVPGKGPSPSLPADPPLVSVIVPSRNEEGNIRDCVEHLMAQDYPRYEVIVADESDDRTVEILAELQQQYPKLRVIHPPPPPPDWKTGRSHAMWHASGQASGDWLLFVDADTRLFPHALREAVAVATDLDAGMFCAVPRVRCEGFWERVILPVVARLTWISSPLWKINDPRSAVVGGSGPLMMVRREAYFGAGGHESVKQYRLDDLELATLFKAQGIRVHFVVGSYLCEARFYTNFTETFRGIARIFFPAVRQNIARAAGAALGAFALTVAPLAALVTFAVLLLRQPTDALLIVGLLLACAQCCLIVLGDILLKKLYRLHGCLTALHSLGAMIVIVAMVKSTLDGVRGKGIVWRGRQC